MKNLLFSGLTALSLAGPAAALAVEPIPDTSLLSRLSAHPRWIENDQNMLAAAADRDAAKQPLFNPELSLSYENSNDPSYQVAISQTLDIFEKRNAKSRVAATQHKLQQLRSQQSNNSLMAETVKALSERRFSEQQLALVQRSHRLMEELVVEATKRFQAGDLGKADLELVRLSRAKSRLTQIQAINRRGDADSTVMNLLGQRPLAPLPSLPALALDSHPDFRGLSLQMLEVKIAQVTGAIAQGDLAMAQLKSKANPTLSLGLGRDGDDNLVALTFSMPLNIHNNYRAEERAAQHRRQGAEQALADAWISGESRLKGLWNKLQVLNQGRRDWREGGADQLASYNGLLQRIWQLGEITTSEYLQNLHQQTDAQASAIQLESQFYQTTIDWLESNNQLQAWLQD